MLTNRDNIHVYVALKHFQNHLLVPDKVSTLKNLLHDEQYFPALQNLVDQSEHEGRNSYESFSDEMMIYYFVHEPRHIMKEYSRKDNTKTEYIRDLLQFYSLLIENKDFFKEDVLNYTDGSVFKNLEKRHIRKYHYWLKDEAPLRNGKLGYGMATMLKKVTVVRGFLKWLYEVGYIPAPVHLGFLSNQLRRKDRPKRDLSYEEVKALIDFYCYHAKNHALLTLLATTGSRCQELSAAKWCDLFKVENEIYLHTDTKGDKERDVLILPVAFERLQTYRRRLGLPDQLNPNDDWPIFSTSSGKKYSTSDLTRYVRNIIKQTKLPFLSSKSENVTPHFFRHYFAQEALRSGADLFDIQETLGHEDIKTTQIYVKSLQEKQKNVARFLDNKPY